MIFEVKYTLQYSKDDLWVQKESDDIVRIGVTDYAQKMMKEITFVELPEEGDDVTGGEAFGSAESTKTVSKLIAPLSGKVAEVNEGLLDDPSSINKDPYGEGWLIRLRAENLDDTDLLGAADYKSLRETE